MKRLSLLFLALSLGLSAQTITGMSGIELSGNPSGPSLTNKTNKTIVATLLVIQRTNGHSAKGISFQPQGIAPEGVVKNIGFNPHFHSASSDIPITNSILTAVVFSDGEVRGDDSVALSGGTFHDLVIARFRDYNNAAKLADSGQWDTLTQTAAQTDHDHKWSATLAARLIRAKNTPKLGELIYQWNQLPTTLWRAK